MIGRIWMSLRYIPLDNSANFDEIHEEIAQINPPPGESAVYFVRAVIEPIG